LFFKTFDVPVEEIILFRSSELQGQKDKT